jgi:mono/diheme cytochrome c family protein
LRAKSELGMHQRLRFFRNIALAVPAAVMVSVAWGQTTGDSTAGQQLFTTTLSPQCSGCHSTTNASAANSLTIIRNDITNRATPAGAAGTLSFAKALEALDRALTGTTLGGAVTGMNGFYTLTSTQRGDLAAYIAGLAGLAPILSYSPDPGGATFSATAVGASSNATVTIRNTGTAPLTFAMNDAVTIATGGDTAEFSIASTTCNPGSTLAPNGSCTITATFAPTASSKPQPSASIGIVTTTMTRLVPMVGSVAVPATTTPPTGSANSPSSGGGGSLPWMLAVVLLLATAVPVHRKREG